MTTDIKELVERLDEHWGRRRLGDMSSLLADAADSLERLVAERDHLKAEVERLRNEKVAGGPTGLEHEAQVGSVSSPAPATDPAPAVCEWTRTPYTALYSPRCDEDYLSNVTDSGICRRCGRPIKFTWAKE